MRRMATILAVAALMVTFFSGVALATFEAYFTGTDRTDIFTGTNKDEQISGVSETVRSGIMTKPCSILSMPRSAASR